MDAAIKQHGTIRVLWDLEHFDGCTARAAWDDMVFGSKMWHSVERMIVLGDRQREEVTAKLFQHLCGKFRCADRHNLQHAWGWLEEG